MQKFHFYIANVTAGAETDERVEIHNNLTKGPKFMTCGQLINLANQLPTDCGQYLFVTILIVDLPYLNMDAKSMLIQGMFRE